MPIWVKRDYEGKKETKSKEEIDEEDDNWKEASKLKPYPHLRNEKTIEQRWLINFCLFAVLWTSFLVLEKS